MHESEFQHDGPSGNRYDLWTCTHSTEEQKRLWHHDSLGVGERKVADQWGFSSTGVSRVPSPEPLSEGAGGNRYGLWSCTHSTEEQKRMWHHESLGVGDRKVADQWGFSSTGVSRVPTPEPLREGVGGVSKVGDVAEYVYRGVVEEVEVEVNWNGNTEYAV